MLTLYLWESRIKGDTESFLDSYLVFLNLVSFWAKQLLPFFLTPNDMFSVLFPSCTSSDCLLDTNTNGGPKTELNILVIS